MHRFTGDQLNLAIRVNRLVLPIISCILLTSSIVGYLQSINRFTSTSLIGVSLNIVFVLYLLIIGNKFGIIGLAIATVAAYLSQVLVLIPEVFHSKYLYNFHLNFKDTNLIQTIKLSLPVMIGLSAQQINIIVDKTMASSLTEGSIASLSYAAVTSTIFLEVFVVSITTVIFPVITKAAANNDMKKLRVVVIKGFKIILLITIPASVGMIVLANPIIRVIFERGAFDNNATEMTVSAFALYSIALVFFSLKRLAQKVYYSVNDTKTPMINSLLEVFVNIGLNLILVRYLGHRGLAFSTSLAVMITSLLFLKGITKIIGGVNKKSSIVYLAKIIISSTIMGLVLLLFRHFVMSNKVRFYENFTYLMIATFVGAYVFFQVCKYLKVKEILENQISGKLLIVKKKFF